MIDFKTIQRFSLACPSQWKGSLTDGRCFYGRYRHGRLTIEFSKIPMKFSENNADWKTFFDNSIVTLDCNPDVNSDGYMTNWKLYLLLLKMRMLNCGKLKSILIRTFGPILSKIEEKRTFGYF